MIRFACILIGLSLLSAICIALDLPILEGELTASEILKKLPEYQKGLDAYEPDAAVLTKISLKDNGIEIYVVFGSWCSDSLEQVPRFMKIMELLSVSQAQVHYLAVNRTKHDPEGMTDTLSIQKVPTFIFFKNGKELGRIVEKPQKKLEEDISQILG